MSSESPVGSGDEDLERRIAALESEEWLGALKGLKPVQGVDLYAIGFEAGKQAAGISNQSASSTNGKWFHVSTAVISSVASVAATVLVMFALPDSEVQQVVLPGTAEVAEQLGQPTNELEQSPILTAENESYSDSRQPDPSLNDSLADLRSGWRDRLQGMEIKVPDSDDSNRVVDVEPSRLRYAFQRRQLIENLGETIQ